MNSFILVIPIIFIRYILMRIIDKEALKKAGFFPPTEGKEQVAFYIYQITTLFLLIYLFFSEIKFNTVLNYVGLIVYIIGTILIIFQISVHFLILSEERWCIKEFGEEYKKYMKKVRRYI